MEAARFRPNDGRHVVVFCTPRSAMRLREKIAPGGCRALSSEEIGLPIGVRALAVKRKALPKGFPIQSGGGTVRIVSPNSVIWAGAPEKYEAGTPAIVNVVAFAKALQVMRTFGSGVFRAQGESTLTAAEILHGDELSGYAGLELLRELRKTVVGRDALVPSSEGARLGTNLDNGASTPTFSPIWDVVCRTWSQPEQVKRLLKIHPLRARAADLGLVLFPRLTSLILPGLVRISLGVENDENDVDHLIRTLSIIALLPRTATERLFAWAHNGTPLLPHTETQARMREFSEAIISRVYTPPSENEKALRGDLNDLLKKAKRKFCCCALKA